MKLEELSVFLHGEIIKRGNHVMYKKIRIDSRKVEKGDLFIAIRGREQDGHNYIEEAILKGASMVLTEKPLVVKQKVGVIKVEDTMESLWLLANYYRSKYPVPVIAITGSVGKTTTKNLIATVLGSHYKVLKSEKSFNNHYGVPMTLLELNDDYDVVVLELGMNHAGEISRLSHLCKPDVGIITNIGTSHIGNLGSQKNIFKAKMEILDGMNEMGILIVNDDDPYLHSIKEVEGVALYRVGTKDTCDLKVLPHKKSFEVTVQQETYEVPILEDYLLPNYVLALQIGILFGMQMNHMLHNLKQFTMEEHRLETITKEKFIILDDSYNASYESFVAVLSTLDLQKKYLFILGDIAELGKYHKKIHKKLGILFQSFQHKKLLLVGSDVKYIAKKNKKDAQLFSNNQEIIHYLETYPLEEVTILLKGSHVMRLQEIRDYLEQR